MWNSKKYSKRIDVKGKKVLVRCDFNVPQDENGNITDNRRIVSALDTIKYLQISKLDDKTICKGITKTIESHRITKNQKDNLKKIRQILNEKKLKKL